MHHFTARIEWTGNTGTGTSAYAAYERSHVLSVDGKAALACSSAPVFRGDGSLYNPEDMLLYSVAACHMLWFLHCCADAGVVVTGYVDTPEGTLASDADGIGRFTEIILHPQVTLADASRVEELAALHAKAHRHCFIANSLNTLVVVR
jgi:organic hydroperoxide reductase OsmC/OhrA